MTDSQNFGIIAIIAIVAIVGLVVQTIYPANDAETEKADLRYMIDDVQDDGSLPSTNESDAVGEAKRRPVSTGGDA